MDQYNHEDILKSYYSPCYSGVHVDENVMEDNTTAADIRILRLVQKTCVGLVTQTL